MQLSKLITILIFAVVAYGLFGISVKYMTARKLVGAAKPYQNITEDYTTTLLVIGDSTGVGVGVSAPEDTVAGLLARDIEATYVENVSVSGAVIGDLKTQIGKTRRDKYSHIMIQIGGNDIIRFHKLEEDRVLLEEILQTLPETDKLTVLSAGNVGNTTFFPFFMRPIYTKRTLAYHKMFEELFAGRFGTYVNLYIPPAEDPFTQDPKKYFSADGLHPSSAGYKLWFEKIKSVI